MRKMRSLSNSRRFARRRAGLPPVEIQQLETRILPAGVVSILADANGNVTVTGDSASNIVEIVIDGAGVRATGFDGTRIRFDGNTFAEGEEVQLPLQETNQMRVALKGGNDGFFLTIDGERNVTVAQNVTIELSSGDDDVEISIAEGSSLDVRGAVVIDGSSGNDTIEIFGAGFLSVEKAFDIKAGTGNDAVLVDVGSLDVFDNFTVNGNFGNDVISLFLEDASLGDVRIQTGSGNNKVEFVVEGEYAEVDGSLVVEGGSAVDTVVIGGTAALNELLDDGVFDDLNGGNEFYVGRDLLVSTGSGADVVVLAGVSVTRDLSVATGSSDDVIAASDLEAGQDVNFRTDAGNDRVFADTIDAGRHLRVDTGAGNDDLVLEDLFLGDATGLVDIKMGAGNDDFAVRGETTIGGGVISIKVSGGTGIDDLLGPEVFAEVATSFEGELGDENVDDIVDAIIDDILDVLVV